MASTTLRLLACVGVASASYLTPANFAPPARPRARRAVCEETLPDAASEAIPPAKMAEAWRRDEASTELRETLKGCSLYVTGLGARKNAVGRALARRLDYRYYDVPALMCSTYKTLSGSAESQSLQTLVGAEPLADVQELSTCVMREVQALVKSVIVVWDGAVAPNDFMMMQQGIVTCVESPEAETEVALPADGGDDALASWRTGHAQADVTIALEEGMLPDDAAALLIKDLLAHIAKNPAMSKGWKAEADRKLAEQDGL